MSAATVTILRSVDGALLTKTITRREDGGFEIEAYDRCTWVAVESVPVDGIVSLGRLIAELERDPHCCIIRGLPKPGTNLKRTRRLFHDHREDDGSVTPATFDAAPSQVIGIDVDSLDSPTWCPEALAARRAAIKRDRAVHPIDQLPTKGPSDGEDYDFAGDGDRAAIDPARDHEMACRAAINELPEEFHDASCHWQMTSGAGVKAGIRLRLWYWCERPVSDAEAKRWLSGSPVDTSLYRAVQPHYVANPIFSPATLDPVSVRSGFFWRHVNAVAVPELPEPPPPPEHQRRPLPDDASSRRAAAYAESCFRIAKNAASGDRHPALRSAAMTVFGLVEHGLLNEQDAWDGLRDAAAGQPWPETRAEELLIWCRAFAAHKKPLPKGFR